MHLPWLDHSSYLLGRGCVLLCMTGPGLKRRLAPCCACAACGRGRLQALWEAVFAAVAAGAPHRCRCRCWRSPRPRPRRARLARPGGVGPFVPTLGEAIRAPAAVALGRALEVQTEALPSTPSRHRGASSQPRQRRVHKIVVAGRGAAAPPIEGPGVLSAITAEFWVAGGHRATSSETS